MSNSSALGPQKIHLPGLNGLRAIAAVAVVVSHLNLELGSFGLEVGRSLDLAGYGVVLFFALSGFLISLLLLIEKDRFGRVDIAKFYWRRVLRIWPLYYGYLALVLAVVVLRHLPLSLPGLACTVFLMPQVASSLWAAVPLTTHYWSLGVEEQFYLFWPLLLQRSTRPAGSIAWFLGLLLLLKWALQMLAIPLSRGASSALFSVLHFDCMAIGALGACLYFHTEVKAKTPGSDLNGSWPFKMLCVVRSWPVQVVCWGVLVAAACNRFNVVPLFDIDLFSLASVGLILKLGSNRRSMLSLAWRPLDFLGRISFGIYVYHMLVMALAAQVLRPLPLPPALKLPLVYATVLLATILAAHLSFLYYEKPFLRFKERFSRVPSTNRGA